MVQVVSDNALFERVVLECGLSKLFARNSILRALKRAGVDAATMTPRDLNRALPEIRRTLEAFIDNDLEVAMGRIERLAK
jgi:hypothetical protein